MIPHKQKHVCHACSIKDKLRYWQYSYPEMSKCSGRYSYCNIFSASPEKFTGIW